MSDHVATVRRFNRFYTRRIGVLNQRAYASPFSLTEVRVLYELAHRTHVTASELGRDLGLDAGYLSRIVRGFRRRKLIRLHPSRSDRRQVLLALSAKGRTAFAPLDHEARAQVAAMLRGLSPAERESMVNALRRVERLLARNAPGASRPLAGRVILRAPRAGDMGWVVHRHGALYAVEYGFDTRFEALVATIVAEFVNGLDAKRERCWIAERQGEIVGSVFLVNGGKGTAKLRLLFVEPSARGLGIGKRLVYECVAFARKARYEKVTLWTQDILTAARHIYQQAGFRVVGSRPHRDFGPPMAAETWELSLQDPPRRG